MGARTRLWASVALLVCATFGLVGRARTAGAQGGATYRASASAEGVRTGVAATGAPLSNAIVDVASPIAQAAIDTTTGSSALASVAYPGDLAVTAPGLVAGFSGGATSGAIPEYPLIAVAGSTTTPTRHVDAPGASMDASANARKASATAASGVAPGTTRFSTSAVVTTTAAQVVSATAASDVDGVTVGPLVLGHVASRSAATRKPNGGVTRKTSFAATGATVGGTGVTVTSDGLVVSGTTIPISASPLQAVLDSAGIAVRVVRAEKTNDGIVSAALIVTRSQDIPGPISPAAVSYVFGRAATNVSPLALSPTGAYEQGLAGVAPAGSPAGPAAGGGTSAGSSSPPAAAEPGAVSPVALQAARATPSASRAITGPSGLFDATTFYLVLVAAAGCAGIVLELLRRMGVQLQWT